MNPLIEASIDVLRLIAPSLLSVLLGAFFVQRFFIKRANEAAMIDFLIKELRELRMDALEYWNLSSKKEDEKQRQIVLAQKIKGAIKSISADINHYCKRYCKNRTSEMERLLVEVADACTGGDFESSKKQPDKARFIVVTNTISRVKSELMQRKL